MLIILKPACEKRLCRDAIDAHMQDWWWCWGRFDRWSIRFCEHFYLRPEECLIAMLTEVETLSVVTLFNVTFVIWSCQDALTVKSVHSEIGSRSHLDLISQITCRGGLYHRVLSLDLCEEGIYPNTIRSGRSDLSVKPERTHGHSWVPIQHLQWQKLHWERQV